MADGTDHLAAARAAHRRQDWPVAATRFAACGEGSLGGDDLTAFADAAFWLGDTDDALRLTTAAHDAFLHEGRRPEPGMSAVMLGIFHLSGGDEPQGTGGSAARRASPRARRRASCTGFCSCSPRCSRSWPAATPTGR